MIKYIKPSEEMSLTVIDGKVCEGTICGVILTIVEGKIAVDGYRFKHNGEEKILPSTQEFYLDESAFKNDTSLIPCTTWDGINGLTGWNYQTLWYYKNGKAEPWSWKGELISWEILPNYNAKLLNGFIPDELFGKQEDIYNWHDLIMHKDNGDIEIKKAPLSVLRLNDKQKVLFDRFKALLKEMNDSGMMIIEDRDRSDFIIANCSEYELEHECDNDYSPTFPSDMHFVMRNLTYYYSGNDERMSIYKKK